MIIIRVIGGLGNQLFQYALGRQLAITHDTELMIDISGFQNYQLRNFELSNFDINLKVASQQDLPYRKRTPPINRYKAFLYDVISNKVKIKEETAFHFDPKVLAYPDNIYLDGYWQSEKYFHGVVKQVKEELNCSIDFAAKQNDLKELINNSNSVSLHVRRGDYINNKHNHSIYSICSINYYQDSINHIKNNVKDPYFFIFSDDIAWVKKNLNFSFKHYFVTGNEASVDLQLMARCKHNIIANSTFSWWGAYLGNFNNKIVIGPKQWFTKNITHDTSDLLPANWITL